MNFKLEIKKTPKEGPSVERYYYIGAALCISPMFIISPFWFVVLLIPLTVFGIWYLSYRWRMEEEAGRKPRLGLPFINNDQVIIKLNEFSRKKYRNLFSFWDKRIDYHEGTYLYKAATQPDIPALNNLMISLFKYEVDGGVLLQKITQSYGGKEYSSHLIWLNYQTLEVEELQEIGPYCIGARKTEPNTIAGYNDEGSIEIRVKIETA